jgi:peptidyl-prolyl cis-trans isomerase B (cyclophilin B)
MLSPPHPVLRTALVSFATAVAACGTDATSDAAAPGTNPPSGSRYVKAPDMTIDTAKTYAATMVTSKGTIELSLYPKDAPITVNNFVFLARDKYYDGLTFHRVVADFVIQGGDPTASGNGGPGYTIPDEVNALKHVDGALAMAKTSAPNSAGSQFYITLGPQSDLDGRYTVFGQVTSGNDVVRKIVIGDKIESVTVTER